MHTPPTPWTMELDPLDGSPWLYDANGHVVSAVFGDTPEQARATADLILSAVNGPRDFLRGLKAAAEIVRKVSLERNADAALDPNERIRLLTCAEEAENIAALIDEQIALSAPVSERQQRADNAAMGDDEGRS